MSTLFIVESCETLLIVKFPSTRRKPKVFVTRSLSSLSMYSLRNNPFIFDIESLPTENSIQIVESIENGTVPI